MQDKDRTHTGGRVVGLWRFPVKSMLGEQLDRAVVTARGVDGDRRYGVLDTSDGRIASAKNPRKWGVLLSCWARTQADRVWVTLPDGTDLPAGEPALDLALTRLVGRSVKLVDIPPDGTTFEEVWPEIEGLAPQEVIAATNIGAEPSGEKVSAFPLSMASPPGTFFDVAPLHLMTTASLDSLTEIDGQASFDVRRYRPNILVRTDLGGYPENDWPGRSIRIGSKLVAAVTMPTMRCVMTTLAQDDLPRDLGTLRTIAQANRIEIQGLGTWACVGAYANVVDHGEVRVDDEVQLV